MTGAQTAPTATAATLIREYVCSQCGAGLVEIWSDEAGPAGQGGFVVVCARRCQPGDLREPFIKRSTHERRVAANNADAAEVARLYPELAAADPAAPQRPHFTPEERAKLKRQLYGDDPF